MICKKNKSSRNRFSSPGFTLVEVMVALMILALSLTALQFRITQHVNNSAYLRDKTVAGWIAQNQLELLRLESRLENATISESRSGIVTMAGKSWLWQAVPQTDAGQDTESRIVPLVISVADNNSPDSPLATLTGVTDAWHRLQ